ncbi:MAG: RHS repeat-associated core domain-containing protein, partial [Acutalibacteraceae bacterium]
QSRYYDPETGRFINADDPSYIGAGGSVLSYNAFAYCENNPVNALDTRGYANDILVSALVEVIMALFYLKAFLDVLLVGMKYEINKNGSIDKNGMFKAKVEYYNNKKKRTFSVVFGDKNAWKLSSLFYNDKSSFYLDYYGSCVFEEGMKTSTSNSDFNPTYLFIMNNIVLRGTIIYYLINASNAKKIYNAVWGEKGIDSKSLQQYIVYKITKDKAYNGIYAFSLKSGKYRKVLL